MVKVFDSSKELKEWKEKYLKVNTKGVENDTYEKSAYIYSLLVKQDPDERLEYLKHLKVHYEGCFPCLMKELIYRENMVNSSETVEELKEQLNNGELSLDEYKSKLKSIVKN